MLIGCCSRCWMLTVVAMLGLCACEAKKEPGAVSGGQAPPKQTVPALQVLARVNGEPITTADLEHRLGTRADAVPDGGASADRQAALESLVTEKLAAQKGEALYLESEPSVAAMLAHLEAPYQAARRRALADLYSRRQVAERVAVTEAEARKYFEDHAEEMGQQLHVLQLLRQGREAVDALARELTAGKPFEEVARSLYPGLQPGQTPWDMGFMSYHKLPARWRAALRDLKVGKVSEPIPGPGNHFWLIKLVARRTGVKVEFDAIRDELIESLRKEREAAVRDGLDQQLRAGAKIEYPGETPAGK